VLQVYVVALFLVPSIVVVQGLGSVGSPATLLGAGLLAWWAVSRLAPGSSASGRQPMRVAVGVLLVSVAASYVAAGLRGYDGLEQRAGDRGVLMIAGMIGVTLVAADGIRSRERLDALLRVVVGLGAAMAVIGLLQFRFSFDVAAIYQQVPGLTFNGTDNFVFDVGVHRVASTAGHPIEFGMVLTLILPIALHRAFHAPPGRTRGAWLVAALIGVGIPLSISRSAVVSLVVALVVLCVGWPSSRRWWVAKVAPAFLLAVRLVAPGTLGTLWTGLLGMQNDPSIQGRAKNRALVVAYIADRPFLGRGFATFLPERYLLLDNQYLGILVELGVVGLGAVLGVFGVALVLAVRIRRRTGDEETRDLALALAASVAAAAAGLATFDGFGFASFAGLVFLLFGCIGALARLTREAAPVVARVPTPRVGRR
jgi:O-antigen ligase